MPDDDIDPYENIDQFDHYGWLAATPPALFGPAIHTTLTNIKRLRTDEQAHLNTLWQEACDADPDRYDDAAQRADDAYDEHPIGASSSCMGTTDLGPWVEAVRLRIGDGMSEVLKAVALRDHQQITDADFETLTGWWVKAGQTLPDPISDTDRAALVAWWDEQD